MPNQIHKLLKSFCKSQDCTTRLVILICWDWNNQCMWGRMARCRIEKVIFLILIHVWLFVRLSSLVLPLNAGWSLFLIFCRWSIILQFFISTESMISWSAKTKCMLKNQSDKEHDNLRSQF